MTKCPVRVYAYITDDGKWKLGALQDDEDSPTHIHNYPRGKVAAFPTVRRPLLAAYKDEIIADWNSRM